MCMGDSGYGLGLRHGLGLGDVDLRFLFTLLVCEVEDASVDTLLAMEL